MISVERCSICDNSRPPWKLDAAPGACGDMDYGMSVWSFRRPERQLTSQARQMGTPCASRVGTFAYTIVKLFIKLNL